MERGNEPYETLATALARESAAHKDVIKLETMGTMRERLAAFQGDRKKSLMTDDLIPTSGQSAAMDAQEAATIQICSEQIESAYKCINDLDWQVSKAKHVI